MKPFLSIVFIVTFMAGCNPTEHLQEAQQWTTYEITLEAEKKYGNPYTETDVWAEFKNEKGTTLLRPAFWNGGVQWKIRFAPPDAGSVWTWTTFSSTDDAGLAGKTGSVKSVSYTGENNLIRHGLLRMSPGKRNVIHADQTPFLVIGDTPWGIPFRAKPDQVKVYAMDRQKKRIQYGSSHVRTARPLRRRS